MLFKQIYLESLIYEAAQEVCSSSDQKIPQIWTSKSSSKTIVYDLVKNLVTALGRARDKPRELRYKNTLKEAEHNQTENTFDQTNTVTGSKL